MEFLTTYGYLILGIVIILLATCIAIWKFKQLSNAEQIEKVEEWLLEACTKAEQELASDAGQEKLQLVYERFETQFPTVAVAISFTTFSKWVDAALEELSEALEAKTETAIAVDDKEEVE